MKTQIEKIQIYYDVSNDISNKGSLFFYMHATQQNENNTSTQNNQTGRTTPTQDTQPPTKKQTEQPNAGELSIQMWGSQFKEHSKFYYKQSDDIDTTTKARAVTQTHTMTRTQLNMRHNELNQIKQNNHSNG